MKTKIKDIKLDAELMGIRPVNQFVVGRYRQAMRNGDRFPLLVLDSDMTLICGYHRYEAYLQEYGEEHAPPVTVKKYRNEAERIEDAIRDNARHGMPLDGITRKRAIAKLGQLGRTSEQIAQLLAISVKRVEEIAGFVVVVRGKGKAITHKPVKAGAEAVVGKTVTAADYEEHIEKDLGISPIRNAQQLRRWVENGWIDKSDEKLMAELKLLADALMNM